LQLVQEVLEHLAHLEMMAIGQQVLMELILR